jgi:general secretion pathway protein B
LSYILDALKKADADRERAAVPGLHARPQDALSGADEPRRALPWLASAATAIVVLGGTLAWVLLSQPDVRVPPLAEAPVPPAPAPTPMPAPMPAPAPAPVAAALPTVTEPAPTPTVVLPPPAPAPAPPAPARATTPPAATSPTATAPAAATPAAARVPMLAELPADLRAQLPPLAISGAVYSSTPSARLLFIGGQVLKEGDAVAPGVVVEQIGASASLLSVRGQRFQVTH